MPQSERSVPVVEISSLIKLSRKAAKELKETIHALRKQVQSVDETIQEQQVRLGDLSVEVRVSFRPDSGSSAADTLSGRQTE